MFTLQITMWAHFLQKLYQDWAIVEDVADDVLRLHIDKLVDGWKHRVINESSNRSILKVS